jgi:GNAT superfamily N-acetyltransferase
MPDVEIRRFSDQHLDAAAALLGERHERHLTTEPLLARDVDYRAQIQAIEGDGVVALVGGELCAYLIAEVTEDDAFVGFAGCAAREPELVRDLYAALAPAWERDRHRVYVPATDDGLIDAWFRLAFGLHFMYAVRETGADAEPPLDVDVRFGAPTDLDAVAAFDRELWEHQTRAPSFSGRDVPGDEAFRDEWRSLWDDARFTHFVAERGGRVVGHAVLYRRDLGDLRIPHDNIDLAHVVTLPDARGSGVGLALTLHALDWARNEGFRSLTTDWRVVNLLSSRFWPRRGFRPTFFRLYRHIP